MNTDSMQKVLRYRWLIFWILACGYVFGGIPVFLLYLLCLGIGIFAGPDDRSSKKYN